jgi:hypothetical protein
MPQDDGSLAEMNVKYLHTISEIEFAEIKN